MIEFSSVFHNLMIECQIIESDFYVWSMYQFLQIVEMARLSVRPRFFYLEFFTQEKGFFHESSGRADSTNCLNEIGIHIFIKD